MDDKLTRKSQEALSVAIRKAAANGNPQVDPLHLLAALLEQADGTAAPLLRAVGADPALLAKEAGDADRPAAEDARRHHQRPRDVEAAPRRDQHGCEPGAPAR